MEPLFPILRLRGKTNRLRTRSLFVDVPGVPYDPNEDYLYTLEEFDTKGCISMYRIYMECDTEYEAAIRLLGSWKHWQMLIKCTWFKPYRDLWEEERRLKDKSLAKKILMEQTEKGNVNAAKALSDFEMEKKRGRPSKSEKAQLSREEKEIEDFLKKAKQNIKVVSGGKQ